MKTTKNTLTEDQQLWLVIGVTTLVLVGVGYWYYRHRKGKEEMLLFSTDDNPQITTTTKDTKPVTISSRFRCSSRSYPLSYGTCHKDVEVLQAYLKNIYKAELGSSGKANDGVDGMFGNKTNKAAKLHLGKTSFAKKDIEGMKTAMKTIRK
ncbi:MAG: hypothetical protein CL613_11155 [Aquimarina sp.]|nr:hypothetical protein [Aquimarina sp.]